MGQPSRGTTEAVESKADEDVHAERVCLMCHSVGKVRLYPAEMFREQPMLVCFAQVVAIIKWLKEQEYTLSHFVGWKSGSKMSALRVCFFCGL